MYQLNNLTSYEKYCKKKLCANIYFLLNSDLAWVVLDTSIRVQSEDPGLNPMGSGLNPMGSGIYGLNPK